MPDSSMIERKYYEGMKCHAEDLEAECERLHAEIAELKENVLELQSLYVIRTPWIDPQDEITELKEKHAREIERIKKNHGCAREQGATQYCREALDAHKEADRLRKALEAIEETADRPDGGYIARKIAKRALKGEGE